MKLQYKLPQGGADRRWRILLDWGGKIEKGAVPSFIGFEEAGAEFPEASWLAWQFENTLLALWCNSQMGHIAAARAGLRHRHAAALPLRPAIRL